MMDDLDSEPTIEELRTAITEMVSWKALGSGGKPADLFRQCKLCLLPFIHFKEIIVRQ